jgi:hypothetical protein
VNNENYLQVLHSQNQRTQIIKSSNNQTVQNAQNQNNKQNPKFECWLNPNMVKKKKF